MPDPIPLADHEHGGEERHLLEYEEEPRGHTAALRAAWYAELQHRGVWRRAFERAVRLAGRRSKR